MDIEEKINGFGAKSLFFNQQLSPNRVYIWISLPKLKIPVKKSWKSPKIDFRPSENRKMWKTKKGIFRPFRARISSNSRFLGFWALFCVSWTDKSYQKVVEFSLYWGVYTQNQNLNKMQVLSSKLDLNWGSYERIDDFWLFIFGCQWKKYFGILIPFEGIFSK